MSKKILLLGSTGKMGLAIRSVFGPDYDIAGRNSGDFDAADHRQVGKLIEHEKPDIVMNAVAMLGIDPCEQEPEKALRINTLYPRFLAELSVKKGFLLVHFSTDAVFSGRGRGFYTEEDTPRPLNVYGLTKYGADCFIRAAAEKYYIFRISALFGEAVKRGQFVEKMLDRIKQGEKVLRVSDDIISSPSYSKDAAREIKRVLETGAPSGLYHIANKGKTSLCGLMARIVKRLGLDARIEKASYRDFAHIGIKNICTPIRSAKLPPLRPWQEAVDEYCDGLKEFTR